MATPATYLSLITSEHKNRPLFMAFVAALIQASVDQQYVMGTFSSLFDLDLAVGDQLDKLGAWIGVSRNLSAAISVTTYPTETQLATDTFVRANENPLDPTKWTVATGFGALQIISDACCPALPSGECSEVYTGVSFPPDQWAQIPMPLIPAGEAPVFVAIRSNVSNDDSYFMSIAQPTPGQIAVGLWLAVGSEEIEIQGDYVGPAATGVPILIGAQGSLIFVQVNGFTVLSAVDTNVTSGAPSLDMESVGAPESSCQVNGFVAGKFNSVTESITSLDDDQYRVLLKLFVAMNAWNGTIPGIYTIWNSVFAQEGFKILVQDDEDMTMVVVLLNPPTDLVILAILTQGYFLLRPAGVEINGFYQPSLPISAVPIFGFDAENATVSGFDVGAWMVPVAA